MPHRGAEWDQRVVGGIVRQRDEAIEFEQPTAKEVAKRRMHPKEYWLQQYVRERFRTLGFAAVEGPFDTGPDFRVRIGKKWAWAEVETTWRHYLEHGHPKQPRFRDVAFLITLDETISGSTPELAQLPKRHVRVKLSVFQRWYRPRGRVYRERKIRHAKLLILSREFHSRFLVACPETEGDMAACPSCHLCPYFPDEASSRGTAVFMILALMFVGKRSLDGLRLATVRSADLDRFFRKHLHTVLAG